MARRRSRETACKTVVPASVACDIIRAREVVMHLLSASLSLALLAAAGQPPAADTAYAFTAAYVNSLGHARQAMECLDAEPPPGQDGGMYWAAKRKEAAMKFNDAMSSIESYQRSRHPDVRDAAEMTHKIYGLLRKIDLEVASLAIRAVTITNEEQLHGAMERSTSLSAAKNQTWRMLADATVAVSRTLAIAPATESDPANRLRISADERRRLIAMLDLELGDTIKDGERSRQAAVYFAGYLLRGFLANPDWQSAGLP
jgi:hypothetical protein